MDTHLFRGGRWVIDLNETDVIWHLNTIHFGQDLRLLMNYFVYFLFERNGNLGSNEFSRRYDEIRAAIADVMSQRIDAGARQLCAERHSPACIPRSRG